MKFLLLAILLGSSLAVNAEFFRGRIDIVGEKKDAIVLSPGNITVGGIISNASWGPQEDRKFYLSAETPQLPENEWIKFFFSFTPDADGQLTIVMKGMYAQTKGKKQLDQIWVYWDNLSIDGAVVAGNVPPVVLPIAGDVPSTVKSGKGIINNSFEKIDGKGNPEGWFCNKDAVVLSDKSLAQDGKNMVKVWCNANVAQHFNVKKGAMVTVAGYVRFAASVPATK